MTAADHIAAAQRILSRGDNTHDGAAMSHALLAIAEAILEHGQNTPQDTPQATPSHEQPKPAPPHLKAGW